MILALCLMNSEGDVLREERLCHVTEEDLKSVEEHSNILEETINGIKRIDCGDLFG